MKDDKDFHRQKESTSGQTESIVNAENMRRYLPLAAGVAAAGATLVVVPGLLLVAGFGAGGIAAGSLAAGMMSAAATKGVGMAVVSVFQSVGAAGMAAGTKVAVGTTAGMLTHNYLKSSGKTDGEEKKNGGGANTSAGRSADRYETSNGKSSSVDRMGTSLAAAFQSIGTAGVTMGTKAATDASALSKSAINYFKGKAPNKPKL